MNTEEILDGMGWIHDILLELFYDNKAHVNLLACNWDKDKTVTSKMYPVACSIINNILSEHTIKEIEHWGFSDTVVRDSIYEECENNKELVIKILEKYKDS